MLIVNKKAFISGLLLMASFIALFIVIITPIFPGLNGGKTTGLDYADNMFNSLSKGSSDFFASVQERVDESKDVQIKYNIPITVQPEAPYKKEVLMDEIVKILQQAGASAHIDMHEIYVRGDLGAILAAAVAVSRNLYDNDAEAVSQTYDGSDPFLVAIAWWHFLKPSIKELQLQNNIQNAKAVDMVMRRALETGYNFYGVSAVKVSDEYVIMTAVLVFYVIYTMWYGFAIFHLFDGIGLSMTKPKVKSEH